MAVINFMYILFVLPDDGGPQRSHDSGEDEVDAPGEPSSSNLNYGTFHGAGHPHPSQDSPVIANHYTAADIAVTSPLLSHRGGGSRYGTPPELDAKFESKNNHSSYGTPTTGMFSQETYLSARNALSAALGIVTSVAGMSNPASRYGTPPEYPSDLHHVPDDVSEDVARSRCHSYPAPNLPPRYACPRSAKVGEVNMGVLKGVSMRDDLSTSRWCEFVGWDQSVDEVDSENPDEPQEAPENLDRAPSSQYPENRAITHSFCWTDDSSRNSDDHSHCNDSCSSDVSHHCHSDDHCFEDGHNPDSDHCHCDDPGHEGNSGDVGDGQEIPHGIIEHRTQGHASFEGLYHEVNTEEEWNEEERDKATTRPKEERDERINEDDEHSTGVLGRLIDAVKTTFRYRPNGVRGMVVASVIANFFISFVVPGRCCWK